MVFTGIGGSVVNRILVRDSLIRGVFSLERVFYENSLLGRSISVDESFSG